MSIDILNLKYTADEFDNLVKNVENVVTDVTHDLGGVLELDISENRNFNVIISSAVTGLNLLNAPDSLDTTVKICFIQDGTGGYPIDIGSIESKDTITFSTTPDTFDIGVFKVRPMNLLSKTFCTYFASGFSVPV